MGTGSHGTNLRYVISAGGVIFRRRPFCLPQNSELRCGAHLQVGGMDSAKPSTSPRLSQSQMKEWNCAFSYGVTE